MFNFIRPPHWEQLPLSKKIQHYMIQLDKYHSYYVDKINAKRIVKNILKHEIEIPKTIRILDNYSDVKESDINTNYMIKASHGSGWNLIFEEGKHYDINEVKLILSSWNCPFNSDIEKQYKYIAPVFYVEEKITCRYQGHNGKAYAWCFYCIHNKVTHINVIDKYIDCINRYNLNWELLDVELNGKFHVDKPKELNKMIELAERLSKPFEFVRVDFYIGIDNKIYFSEYTFSPCMGINIYGNLDYEMGKSWI
jgi:hypothetical protein